MQNDVMASETATAPAPNREGDLKKSQARAVLRLLSLQALLGSRLSQAGHVIELGTDAATPLSLLRGLGYSVSAIAATQADAADAKRLYDLDAASGANAGEAALCQASLILMLGIRDFGAELAGRIRATIAAMPEGAVLAIEVEASGGARRVLRQLGIAADILSLLRQTDGGSLIAHDAIYHRLWMVFENRAGAADPGPLESADRFVARWRRMLTAAASVPKVSTIAGQAWQVRAHPRGMTMTRLRAASILKRRRIRRANAGAWSAKKSPVVHFGVHTPANAGDLVLFESVRATLDLSSEQPWVLHNVRTQVTPQMIAEINRSSGIVIGGGGLFLVDNSESSLSGWQWPIPTELLRQIEVPIVIFAVGYNRFRGQAEFPQVFVESLNLLVEKSSFLGIRNRGSIAALTNYLPPELAARLTYQPCATTVMHYLDMPRAATPPRQADRRTLVVNAAFDRFGLRLKGREEDTLAGIAAMAKRASNAGWEIVVACHLFDDEAIVPFLDREVVPHTVRQFTGVSTPEILSFYESVDLVAGMRGHAQMIPFGVGTPIISLVAHDKMGWFLDDIGHPEWGIDFAKASARERMIAAFEHAEANLPQLRNDVAAARAGLWETTQRNVATIRNVLGAG